MTIVRGQQPVGSWNPGAHRDLVVAVRNEGYVTGPLRLWAEPADSDLDLALLEPTLTGQAEQRFVLRTRVSRPSTQAVTLHARAVSPHGDVGGRDRVDVLVRCEEATGRGR